MDIFFVARPAEPEQTTREGHTTDDCRWETPFRNSNAIIRSQFLIVVALRIGDISTSKQHAKHHSKIRQSTNAWVEMVGLLEDDGVGCEEEIEETVDEGHVDTDEEHDGFCDE